MFLPDHFAFSKAERRALIVLLAIIIVLAILLGTLPEGPAPTTLTPSSPSDAPVNPVHPVNPPLPAPFAFDPNTADSATLRALGLSSFVASNIVKYRRAGGRFRRADALARIYGLDSATFTRLRPYIYIAQESPASPLPRPVNPSHSSPSVHPALPADPAAPSPPREPSPYKAYMENKLPDGTFLDLNKADSADLVRIPGIGPYYASRIVRLRRQLGGFVAVSQLSDIPNLPDIGDWVTIEPGTQQRINVNTATLTTLKNHPYIGYYRARAIMNLRHRDGRVLSLRQLSFLDEFSDDDIQRLAPYLSFE